MKKIILISIMMICVYAKANNEIKANFRTTVDKVHNIAINKKMIQTKKFDSIIKTITPIFDFELMAKLSLGKTWRTLTKANRELFVALYVKRLKRSYANKLNDFSDGKIVIDNIKYPKKNRAVLSSHLQKDKTNIEIIFKMHKPKKKKNGKFSWLIYDVVASGISIIKVDRAQFGAILKQSSIDDLLKMLK